MVIAVEDKDMISTHAEVAIFRLYSQKNLKTFLMKYVAFRREQKSDMAKISDGHEKLPFFSKASSI